MGVTDDKLFEMARRHLARSGRGFTSDDAMALVPLLREAIETDRATAKLPEGSPVSEERLEEIRSLDDSNSQFGCMLHRRDLLAAYDHALARLEESEKWCARLANDRENENARIEIGVGIALAIVRKGAILYSGNSTFAEGRQTGHKDAIMAVEQYYGDHTLPPHEQTLAANRRMREALAKLSDHAWGVSGPTCAEVRAIARAALEGRP